MHSVTLEPTKLNLIGTPTTYQATGDAGYACTNTYFCVRRTSRVYTVTVDLNNEWSSVFFCTFPKFGIFPKYLREKKPKHITPPQDSPRRF